MFAARFRDLEKLDAAPAEDRKRRGRVFERFLHELLESERLEPRTSYKPSGEEIDGSFVLDGRTFLFEAKWQADLQPASAIYMFNGKVDGKLTGTLGVFLSMSGFSSDTVNALTHGKDLNVILFDREDLRRAVESDSFTAILKKKLCAAAEQGLVYFDTAAKQLRHRGGAKVSNAPVEMSEVPSDAPMASGEPAIIFICEGVTDEAILEAVIGRLLQSEGRSATVRFLVAGGSEPLPRLADAAKSIAPNAHVVIVAEPDVLGRTLRELQRHADTTHATLVVTQRPLEEWLIVDPALGLVSPEDVRQLRRKHGARGIGRLAQQLDLNQVAQSDETFGLLVNALRAHSSPKS